LRSSGRYTVVLFIALHGTIHNWGATQVE
jgi:hypothetical protein